MEDAKSQLKQLTERLKQERDELRVKMNLAKKEARDEWDELEGKWDKLRGRLKVVEDAADDAGDEIGAAAKMLVDEIKKGYEKIRTLV